MLCGYGNSHRMNMNDPGKLLSILSVLKGGRGLEEDVRSDQKP